MKLRSTIFIVWLCLLATVAGAAVHGNRITQASTDADLVAALNQLGFYQGINQPPTASFTYATNNYTVTFTNTSTDNAGVPGFITGNLWNFGDGFTSLLSSPTHTYIAPGVFLVSLTVTDNGGLTNMVTQAITLITTNTPVTNPAVNIASVTINEPTNGLTNAVFTVRLDATNSVNVTLNYATTDGTAIAGADYTATNGALTFAPGITNLSVTVAVLSNLAKQSNVVFYVDISSVSNATPQVARGVGTIINYIPGTNQNLGYDLLAASASREDVSAAVNLLRPGQTVKIPPGVGYWSNTIVLNGVSLLGSGTNQTLIYDCCTNRTAGKNLVYLLDISGGNCAWSNATYIDSIRFSNLLADPYLPGDGTYNQARIVISSPNAGDETHLPTNAPVVFQRCSFEQFKDNAIAYYGGVNGLVTQCSFWLPAHAVRVNAILAIPGYSSSDAGDIYSAMPPVYGTTNQVVMENCFYTNTSSSLDSGAVVDFEGGSSVTVRYSTLLNSFGSNHGIDSSQNRSGRIFEFYGNIVSAGDSHWNTLYPTTLRGGSGVIYGNTISGYAAGTVMTAQTYRNTMLNIGPYYGANGTFPFDSNGVVALSYTMTCAAPLLDSVTNNTGTPWTTDQWKGYVVRGKNCFYVNAAGNTNYLYATVTGNSANIANFTRAKSDGEYYLFSQQSNNDPISTIWSNNVVVEFRNMGPLIDQVGWAGGDKLVRMLGAGNNMPSNTVTHSYAWPHQVLEPVYVWSNVVNGVLKNNVGLNPNVRLGIEVITNAAKPNYNPLVYPHPLTRP